MDLENHMKKRNWNRNCRVFKKWKFPEKSHLGGFFYFKKNYRTSTVSILSKLCIQLLQVMECNVQQVAMFEKIIPLKTGTFFWKTQFSHVFAKLRRHAAQILWNFVFWFYGTCSIHGSIFVEKLAKFMENEFFQ